MSRKRRVVTMGVTHTTLCIVFTVHKILSGTIKLRKIDVWCPCQRISHPLQCCPVERNIPAHASWKACRTVNVRHSSLLSKTPALFFVLPWLAMAVLAQTICIVFMYIKYPLAQIKLWHIDIRCLCQRASQTLQCCAIERNISAHTVMKIASDLSKLGLFVRLYIVKY